jgi:carbamate kinase
LLLLTDVDAVYEEWGTPHAQPLTTSTPSELRRIQFEAGSMAPKVEAACRFVERTGGCAAIGALADAPCMLLGERSTLIRPD